MCSAKVVILLSEQKSSKLIVDLAYRLCRSIKLNVNTCSGTLTTIEAYLKLLFDTAPCNIGGALQVFKIHYRFLLCYMRKKLHPATGEKKCD